MTSSLLQSSQAEYQIFNISNKTKQNSTNSQFHKQLNLISHNELSKRRKKNQHHFENEWKIESKGAGIAMDDNSVFKFVKIRN